MSDVTYKEMISMRDDLNKRMEGKIGRKPAVTFCIASGWSTPDKWAFIGAYTYRISTSCCVNGGYFKDPRDAYQSAIEAIEALPSEEGKKQERIDALKAELADLEAGQ